MIAGEGATPKPGALDNGFTATNNDFDNRATGGKGPDGDLSPGDPGAIPAGGGQGPSGSTVDNIRCDTSMPNDPTTDYHVHAFVGLYVNGQQVVIPDAIGIVHAAGDMFDSSVNWPNQEIYGDCFYHIHTHDDSGMVHLEDFNPLGLTRNDTMFTTGEMFDIWGVQVNAMQFGPFSGPMTIYTSGQFSRADQCIGSGASSLCEVGSNMYSLYTGDPMSIPFYSHEVIWIEIGTGNPDVAHLPGVSFATSQ